MKGFLIALCVLLLGVFVVGFYGVSTLNNFATLDESAKAAWAKVENQYQRRADLIPNLVNTVKGYASHEQDTLSKVIEARNYASQMAKPSANLSDENTFKSYQNAQDNLSAQLKNLLVVVEKYPDLKANQNFISLQDQLEGTENRIANARREYIEAVQSYNTKLRQIPAGWIAKSFGSYEPKAVFEAREGAAEVPVVEF